MAQHTEHSRKIGNKNGQRKRERENREKQLIQNHRISIITKTSDCGHKNQNESSFLHRFRCMCLSVFSFTTLLICPFLFLCHRNTGWELFSIASITHMLTCRLPYTDTHTYIITLIRMQTPSCHTSLNEGTRMNMEKKKKQTVWVRSFFGVIASRGFSSKHFSSSSLSLWCSLFRSLART